MDGRVIVWIWVLLSPFLNVIGSTPSVSLNNYGRKLNENFKEATKTERFKRFTSKYPVHNDYIYAPVIAQRRSRFYRQADSELVTSTESISTTETPLEQTVTSEKYSTLLTTELEKDKETVLPLSSTDKDVSSTSKPETTKENKVTEKDESDDLKELAVNDTNVELTTVDKKDIQSSPVSTQGNESVIASINNTESYNQLTVVGLTELEKRPERIMILPPVKHYDVEGEEAIRNMLARTTLRIETEDYVRQLHQRYEDLPVGVQDNAIWTKFSRAVVEYFVLDFCRNYPHYSEREQSIGVNKVEEYKSIYNTTLFNLKKKKGYTAVQFATPVRRASDIYKAILDTSIGIVQDKCLAGISHWLCSAKYIVRLSDLSAVCENVWYHAEVHLTVLEAIRKADDGKDAASKIIDELDERLNATATDNHVDNLFNVIIETLADIVDKIREPLLTQATHYRLIRKLQSENKLSCLNIDEQQW